MKPFAPDFSKHGPGSYKAAKRAVNEAHKAMQKAKRALEAVPIDPSARPALRQAYEDARAKWHEAGKAAVTAWKAEQ